MGTALGLIRLSRSLVSYPANEEKGAREDALPGDWTLLSGYWSSLVTSRCMLLAWARAEMPVWLRISYFDMLEAADA